MKQEKLFSALADIGDDLIELAETRSYRSNGWMKWLSLAASMVLVLCLSALVLPELPIGCGAGHSMAPEAADQFTDVDDSLMDQEMKEECVVEESEAESEEEAVPADPVPDGGGGAESEEAPAAEELVIGGQVYVTVEWPELELSEDDLGEPFGAVSAAADESLIGCPAYRYEDGLVVVISPDRWILCRAQTEESE